MEAFGVNVERNLGEFGRYPDASLWTEDHPRYFVFTRESNVSGMPSSNGILLIWHRPNSRKWDALLLA